MTPRDQERLDWIKQEIVRMTLAKGESKSLDSHLEHEITKLRDEAYTLRHIPIHGLNINRCY